MNITLGWYLLAAVMVLLCTILMLCWQQWEIARLHARIDGAKQLAILQDESVRLDAYHFTVKATGCVWDFLRAQGLDVDKVQPAFDVDNAKSGTVSEASKTPSKEVNPWD